MSRRFYCEGTKLWVERKEELTGDAGAKFVGKLRDEVIVDAILHGAEHDDGTCVVD